MNKTDRIDEETKEAIGHHFGSVIYTSALHGEGLDDLHQAIESKLSAHSQILEARLGPQDGAARAWLYQRGDVQSDSFDETGMQTLLVRLDEADEARFEKQFPTISLNA